MTRLKLLLPPLIHSLNSPCFNHFRRPNNLQIIRWINTSNNHLRHLLLITAEAHLQLIIAVINHLGLCFVSVFFGLDYVAELAFGFFCFYL